jgi:hypothetical protein
MVTIATSSFERRIATKRRRRHLIIVYARSKIDHSPETAPMVATATTLLNAIHSKADCSSGIVAPFTTRNRDMKTGYCIEAMPPVLRATAGQSGGSFALRRRGATVQQCALYDLRELT